MTCPNGKSAYERCTHPVCPVHRTPEQVAANHASWADLIADLQNNQTERMTMTPPTDADEMWYALNDGWVS